MDKNTKVKQLITIDPDVMSGAPCFFGTRVPIDVLFDNLRDGLSIDEIVDSYPTLTREMVEKVLAHPEQIERAQSAFRANSIMDLDGLPLSKEVAEAVNRIISGEITTEQAVQMKVAEIKERQRMQVTQEMIDNANKIDPARVRASTVEEIRNLLYKK